MRWWADGALGNRGRMEGGQYRLAGERRLSCIGNLRSYPKQEGEYVSLGFTEPSSNRL